MAGASRHCAPKGGEPGATQHLERRASAKSHRFHGRCLLDRREGDLTSGVATIATIAAGRAAANLIAYCIQKNVYTSGRIDGISVAALEIELPAQL